MHPDMVVLARDRPDIALVVEVKASQAQAEDAKQQLAAYMLATKCRVALLVTPETTIVLKDSYRDSTTASIDVAARISTSLLLGQPASLSPRDLERAVFDWLEQVSISWVSAVPLDPTAAVLLLEHIVPAVAEGRVTFGHAA